jgi:hypothetical protein
LNESPTRRSRKLFRGIARSEMPRRLISLPHRQTGHLKVILADSKLKITAGIVILLALMTAPAPLLPPHRLAEGVQLPAGIG